MSKHTPGPWEVSCVHKTDPARSHEGYNVATADGRWFITYNRHGASNEPNARLIAAAPDLLAACQLALQFWYSDQPNDTPEAIAAKHVIRDAVNKALPPASSQGE